LTIGLALVLSSCRETPPIPPAERPAAVPDTPAPSASSPGLPVPFESQGACPFECCVYRTWSVERATGVRAAREKGAPVAFTVRPGDKVEALTGVVVVSRPGRARAPRDVAVEGLGTLRAGDEVSVLHPLGEGFWLVWRDGRKGSAEVGQKPTGPRMWDPQLHQTSRSEYRWWVQVRDGPDKVGWTDEPENFGHKDRCG
jgi:hypothetical protein